MSTPHGSDTGWWGISSLYFLGLDLASLSWSVWLYRGSSHTKGSMWTEGHVDSAWSWQVVQLVFLGE
jgi:hypothetical protein